MVPDLGTRFSFPFILDEQDSYVPFTLNITNPAFVNGREKGRNYFVITAPVSIVNDGHGVLPAYPDALLERVSDYHGMVKFPLGSRMPTVGEIVAVIPNHVCPVIDLRDSFIATRSGVVVGVWPVDARGRSG